MTAFRAVKATASRRADLRRRSRDLDSAQATVTGAWEHRRGILPADADGTYNAVDKPASRLTRRVRRFRQLQEFVGYIVETLTGRPTACASIIVTRANDPYGATGNMTNWTAEAQALTWRKRAVRRDAAWRFRKLLVCIRLLSEHGRSWNWYPRLFPVDCRRNPRAP